MQSLIRSVLFLTLVAAIIRCSSTDEPNPTPAVPTIVDFTPKSAGPGASVTITGSNFSSEAAQNKVELNGLEAAVISASTTLLEVTVPEGDVTGFIRVTVGGSTATSTDTFQGLPVISDFQPKTGIAGTIVFITGSNFSSTPSNNLVTFNGTAATVNSATSTALQVVAPSGVTDGPISVTVGSTTVTTVDDFKAACNILTIVSNTSFGSRTITYTFNANNQVTKSTIVGSGASVTTYAYNASGYISTSTRTAGGVSTSTTYTYDEHHRVKSTSSGGTVSTYTYNSTGQLIRIQYAPTEYMEFTYPNTTTSSYSSETVVSGSSTQVTTFEYDDKRNPTRDVFPSFNFLPENNWTKQTQGSLIIDASHTYNAKGYPLTSTWSGGATGTYTYTYACD